MPTRPFLIRAAILSSISCTVTGDEGGEIAETGQTSSGGDVDVDAGSGGESSESTSDAGDDTSSGEQNSVTDADSDTSTGTGNDTDTGTDTTCPLPEHIDDIDLEPEGITLPGPVDALANAGGHLVVCGTDFIGTMHLETRELSTTSLEAPCSDIAVVDDTHVAITTVDGRLQWWTIDDEGSPTRLDELAEVAQTLHSVTAHEGQLWVAAGPAGVLVYGIEDDRLVARDLVIATDDARDVAFVDASLLVADGFSGSKLYTQDGTLVHQLEHKGEARGIRVDGRRALVLRGFRGLDVVDVVDGELHLADDLAPDGMVLDAKFVKGRVLVNHGTSLAHYALNDEGRLQLLSRERQPGRFELGEPWFFGLAAAQSEHFYTSLGDQLRRFRLGDGEPAPDIHPPFPRLLLGGDAGTALRYRSEFVNVGTADAIITGFETSEGLEIINEDDEWPPPRPGCPGQYVVAPGEDFIVRFTQEKMSGDFEVARAGVRSNDPDEARSDVALWINRPTAESGATTGNLSLVSWHGDRVDLSDYRGKVLLLKVVNSW